VRVRVVNRILYGEHVVLIYVHANYNTVMYKRYYQPTNTTLHYRSSRPSSGSGMRPVMV